MSRRAARFTLSVERLKDLLVYDPDTGEFRWKPSRRWGMAEKVAGSLDSSGHVQIKIDGRSYMAHRLAWLYMTGDWPISEIDHKDTIPSNNIWTNLRLATHSQNRANMTPMKNNTSGFRGVKYHKSSRKWQASIQKDGVLRHLGTFTNFDDAKSAYTSAYIELYDEYARPQ